MVRITGLRIFQRQAGVPPQEGGSQVSGNEERLLSLLHAHPLDLTKMGRHLRYMEKTTASRRRKEHISLLKLPQVMVDIMHRGSRRIGAGMYGLMLGGGHYSKPKDDLEFFLLTIDRYIQWSRSQKPAQKFFSNLGGQAKDLKQLLYPKAPSTLRKAVLVPRGKVHFEEDEESSEEWRVPRTFNMNNSAAGTHRERRSIQNDFKRIVDNLKGCTLDTSFDRSILLPSLPRQPVIVSQEEEEGLQDEVDDSDGNMNAITVIEGANQSQITFEGLRPSQITSKLVSDQIGIQDGRPSFSDSSKLTFYSVYLALRWIQHILALARKKGFDISNKFYLGEITVITQSTSLLAILDLSSANVITCPRLKASLLKANQAQNAHKDAHQREPVQLLKISKKSPQPLLGRNRVRQRRTANNRWSGSGGSQSISSESSSADVSQTTVRSRVVKGTGSREIDSGSPPASRRDSNLVSPRIHRKRSLSSLHMAPRRSSISSTIFASMESEISENEDGTQAKMTQPRERPSNVPGKSVDMASLLQRLRKKNAPGYLSLRPIQRVSEKIKTALTAMTIRMMQGCKYNQVKATRLGPTLAYVLRNEIRDCLIEEHRCEATGCQSGEAAAEITEIGLADTAAFRVITHVAVVEVMQQATMMASQGLQEHHMDTYYSFTFHHCDAVTVATVYLIRQFVKFPNIISTSNAAIREIYGRWLN